MGKRESTIIYKGVGITNTDAVVKEAQWKQGHRDPFLEEATINPPPNPLYWKHMDCFEVTSKLQRRFTEHRARLRGKHLFCCVGLSLVR